MIVFQETLPTYYYSNTPEGLIGAVWWSEPVYQQSFTKWFETNSGNQKKQIFNVELIADFVHFSSAIAKFSFLEGRLDTTPRLLSVFRFS